jgi:ATP-dependent Clp protease ATP-binding subunit ClpA
MIDAAIVVATLRRREYVMQLHLLHALMQDAQGAAVALLERYGANVATLSEELDRAL